MLFHVVYVVVQYNKTTTKTTMTTKTSYLFCHSIRLQFFLQNQLFENNNNFFDKTSAPPPTVSLTHVQAAYRATPSTFSQMENGLLSTLVTLLSAIAKSSGCHIAAQPRRFA